MKTRSIKSILSLVMALMLLCVPFTAFAEDAYIATWAEYTEANGISEYTWNEVLDAMVGVLDAAVASYEGGDSETALKQVTDAKNNYWGASGFKVQMQKKLPSIHKSTAQTDFKALSKAIKNGDPAADVTTAKDVLVADLRNSANKLDGVKIDMEFASEHETVATSLFEEQYYSDWETYSKAAGLESGWTWNDVADAMAEVFRTAKARYADGDAQTAYDCVNDGYYGFYETTGFERNTMGYISGARKSEVELQFSASKSAAKGDSADEFNEAVDILRTMIRTDANKLDGVDEEGNATGGGRSAGVATFIACFTILLREGLEAILVVGAIIAYLVKTSLNKSEDEKKRLIRPVYSGAILGILLSFVSAWLLNQLKLANSASQEIIEGVTALIAVVVLFYVSNWMVSKSEAEAWDAYIKSKVGDAAKTGSSFALAFTAFLAVYREGAEVVLFYQPLLSGGNTKMVWLGFLVGCVVLVVVFLAIRLLSVRLPLKPFFLATSILMAVMSIAFLGSGIKELIEGDVLAMHSPAWVAWIPSNAVLELLGIYPCVETVIPQLILLAITIITFAFWLRRNKKLREQIAQDSGQ